MDTGQDMKKIFISGDTTHPLFHRYQNVQCALESIFDEFDIAAVSEHYEGFETQDYMNYDLVVLYTDHWIDKTGTSHQQVQALVDYIARGGSLLLLHNLDPGVDEELAQMIGARLRHPLQDQGGLMPLTFVMRGDHPVSKGIAAFELEEERFAMDHAMFTQKEVFMEAVGRDGAAVPAGWSVRFGKGRIIYLSPGHDVRSFENPSYRGLIKNAAQWLTEEE